MRNPYPFDPRRHQETLSALLRELAALPETAPAQRDRVLARHPKDGRGFFSKSELLAGLRWLGEHRPEALEGVDVEPLAARLRGKPVRSLSGVAVVTVFTRPHPCPGRCVFCPCDVRMPKSYLADEPGCQRAEANGFDPYLQTWSRLRALANNGHPVDKVELLVLGGTWSSYPEAYQVEFLARCFEALDDAGRRLGEELGTTGGGTTGGGTMDGAALPRLPPPEPAGAELPRLDGRRLRQGRTPEGWSYNRLVRDLVGDRDGAGGAGTGGTGGTIGTGSGPAAEAGAAAWERLHRLQRANETAGCRCVGLALETRPDCLDAAEVLRLRRLGATRVQVGVQSLSDAVLRANRRGHGVARTREAFRLLRGAGFKLQAHWMANLLGSDPEADRADYRRLFADPAFRPDELKVYPCSLVESAELMRHWEAGEWRPYGEAELLALVTDALAATPRWCRLSRVVRDIPGTDVVAGSRVTNLRQVAEADLARRGIPVRDVRAREVRGEGVAPDSLELRETAYATSVGEERFLELVTGDDRLAAFLRLSLPSGEDALAGAAPEVAAELAGRAVVREVHVYGPVAGFGDRDPGEGRPQHRGLGTRLVERAAALARRAGHRHLAVISAVGTRAWYRRLGFRDGPLYQHLDL